MASTAPEMRIFKCPACDTLHIRKTARGTGKKFFHDCGTQMEDVTDELEKYGDSATFDCYD
ncbi:MAG: hypothetical protein HYS73_00010 [Parcubacteria group bacterium]|nr:hypothetical protein [Parcubacteria group bacterium]MBI2049244.1 hypothetical protein [Parcubacteria group bacterium]